MTIRRFIGVFAAVTAIGACSSKSDDLYFKPQDLKTEVEEPGATTDKFSPQVDILFVVDNSGSMGTHQTNLAENITGFTSEFLKQPILSYNIGVVSTDTAGYSNNSNGKLVGTVRVVNKKTPDRDRVLASNLKLGTSGSGSEEPFAATQMALAPDLLATWNLGFLRKSAALVVIFITDAEDQSDISPQSLVDYLVQVKDGNPNKVFAFGAIIPSDETACTRDETGTKPILIEEFLEMTSNGERNKMNLCDKRFGRDLAEAAARIVDEVGNKIYLSRAPDVSTIKVTFGTEVLPNDPLKGWVFHPRANALVLGREIDWDSQPPDAEVKVEYTAAEFKK